MYLIFWDVLIANIITKFLPPTKMFGLVASHSTCVQSAGYLICLSVHFVFVARVCKLMYFYRRIIFTYIGIFSFVQQSVCYQDNRCAHTYGTRIHHPPRTIKMVKLRFWNCVHNFVLLVNDQSSRFHHGLYACLV